MAKPSTIAHDTALLVLENVSLRWSERLIFHRTHWTWRRGEQWAILGRNGSGKSLLALALCGKVPVVQGEIRYHLNAPDRGASADIIPEDRIALLSPRVQRDLVARESTFHQSRWHSGISEGQQTVRQFLSQASVEELNPFEVKARKTGARIFRRRRCRFVRWLGILPLLRRKLIHLSNGEQRKVLLAHTLLRSPQMLILDDPFGGLDTATRVRLKAVIGRLMQAGLPVLVITNRPDEIPEHTTHVLLAQDHRVKAQGRKRVVLQHPVARRAAVEPVRRSSRPFVPAFAAALRHATPLIELNHATIQPGRNRILDDVSWTMRRGEHWALLGPNGSGKTTLLSLIQGDHPQAYAQDIRWFGARLHSTATLWRTRRKIGWVSPELQLHYPPGWSVLQVVCSGFFDSVGLFQSCTRRQRASALAWLREFGLDARADHPFSELPLGDQRLVLLARAVVKKPKLLILDEPCQGLDAAHRHTVLTELDRLVARTGAGLIFVTHHAREMPACITHVLQLKRGCVEQCRPRTVPRKTSSGSEAATRMLVRV